MIPEFPKFKKLELSDRSAVEEVTSKFPPYSDFNFVSMYSWDVHGLMEISILNGNLVVKFTDYINGRPFFSFLGDNMVTETAETILDYSCNLGLPCELRLVPEVVVEKLDKAKFTIKEDRDNFDYILDTQKITELNGGDYKSKRREIKDLQKDSNIVVKPIKSVEEIASLLVKLHAKEADVKIDNENKAIHRLFTLIKSSDIISLGLYDGDDLLGFVVNEILESGRCSVGHFLKTNSETRNGLSTFLLKGMAETLYLRGVSSLNIEQDLGLIGLRKWKENCKPKFYLKKYIILR